MLEDFEKKYKINRDLFGKKGNNSGVYRLHNGNIKG